MDITALFKACVKTVRTRNRAFGVTGNDSDKSSSILPRIQKTAFTLKAREVVNNITRLRDFLLEHRKAYLNFGGHLPDLPQMTDAERDKIDAGAQMIMNTCSHLIQDFKKKTLKVEDSVQVTEHRQMVLDMIEAYLKAVCKIYSEQKAIRVKRAMDFQKFSRFETDSPTHTANRLSATKTISDDENNHVDGTKNSSQFATDEEFSKEELQIYEEENNQLYNELQSLNEEVRQIESKVVHIAELQEIFTEKVLQQDKDIDRINTTVVGATENVKEGNDQIRQAIQRNAGLRIYILLFLLVMSFSLLFLDWYND
ncbi:syntaxin-18 [Neocloeon triangulifer]|uniref:syntaxin-18 n=1 Tax=Neocloeon triangulifer TaxID=2078957 RepID=UPI00286F131D|nr:syntaxin-18 [Neocloeon triangulifer]